MNTIQKRFFLFLFGCIGTRLAFTLLAKNVSLTFLPYLGYLALIATIGFLVIYLFGLRQTGAEVFGNTIWWNDLRPIHGVLYGTFSFMAISQNPNAWIILLIDTLFGLSAFLRHHFAQGNFRYII